MNSHILVSVASELGEVFKSLFVQFAFQHLIWCSASLRRSP